MGRLVKTPSIVKVWRKCIEDLKEIDGSGNGEDVQIKEGQKRGNRRGFPTPDHRGLMRGSQHGIFWGNGGSNSKCGEVR